MREDCQFIAAVLGCAILSGWDEYSAWLPEVFDPAGVGLSFLSTTGGVAALTTGYFLPTLQVEGHAAATLIGAGLRNSFCSHSGEMG